MDSFKETSKDCAYELKAVLPNALGMQKYLIIALNYPKKTVGISDISRAFTRAMQEKSPVILVSATGFAKSARSFWKKEYKDLITLVDGQELKFSKGI